MKIDTHWVMAAILTLPLAWLVSFLLSMRPIFLQTPAFIPPSIIGFILGLITGGLISDQLRIQSHTLVFTEVLILVIGIIQWILPPDFWPTFPGQLLLYIFIFLFGFVLVLFTVFLNRLVSSVRRGQVVGIVTTLTLFFTGIFSLFWRLPIPTQFAPAVTAGLILFVLIIAIVIQPWKGELQTYMAPGSIRPYAIWWIIYLIAFGLSVWATPFPYRILFNSFLLLEPGVFIGEFILMGLAGATFIFTFLPDRFGRKFVFNIATVILGLLCIFGGAQFDITIGPQVSLVLVILQVFVIGFILGVGAWLIWAEIGSVGMKGRRATFGWTMVGLLVAVFWWITVTGLYAGAPLVVYPIAATLVLLSIFSLTNAREVVWNERVIEDIQIAVDSRQVTRALRDLEVDTALRSIEGQIDAQIAQLAEIEGITKTQAKTLRDSGYETLELVARANVDAITQILSLSPEKAEQIIVNAKLLQRKVSKSHKPSTKRKTKK
jgi:hypothetical protein